MSEQGTETEVSLDDLKRAIDKTERYKRAPLEEALRNAVGWCAAERDAWRAAFQWRETHTKRVSASLVSEEALDKWMAERDEGMALILEKLK